MTFSLRSLAQRFRVALLLLAAAAVLGLGGESLRRKIESFQPLGFEAVAAGDHWHVRAVATEARGRAAARRPDRPGRRRRGGEGRRAARPGCVPRQRPSWSSCAATGSRPSPTIARRSTRSALSGARFLGLGYLIDRALHALADARTARCSSSGASPPPRSTSARRSSRSTSSASGSTCADELARLLLPAADAPPLPQRAARADARSRGAALPFVYLPASVLATLQLDLVLFDGRFVFGRADRRCARSCSTGSSSSTCCCLPARRSSSSRSGSSGSRSGSSTASCSGSLVGMVCGYAPFFAHLRPALHRRDPDARARRGARGGAACLSCRSPSPTRSCATASGTSG